MSATPATPGWWRRQRLWLLGIAVFGAWALYMPYRDWRQNAERTEPTRAQSVMQGEWAWYEGARWRLTGMSVEAPRPRAREDAVAVVARYEVIPDAGTRAARLDTCRGRLVDAHGRRWAADDSGRLGLFSALPGSCGSGLGDHFRRIEAQAGKPWAFAQVFEVPRTADPRELRPEIVMPWPERSPVGRLLRFQPTP